MKDLEVVIKKSLFDQVFNRDKTIEQLSDERCSAIPLLVKQKQWERPFDAIKSMSEKDRENMRKTLEFDWAPETLAATDSEKRVTLESWEIIDCNIRGIVARLHTIAEQVRPDIYLSWRKVLLRLLDELNVPYLANADEQDLEKVVVEFMAKQFKRIARGQTDVPTNAVGKLGIKEASLVVGVAKDVALLWDEVLGLQDKPAFMAVYTICCAIHVNRNAQGSN